MKQFGQNHIIQRAQKKTGSVKDYKNKSLRISQKAVTEKGTWYQLQDQGKTIGWVNSDAVEVFYTPKNETNVKLDKYITDSDQKNLCLPSRRQFKSSYQS